MSEVAIAVSKPRLTYAQFLVVQQPPAPTVSWVIERFIREMDGLDGKPPVKTLGSSHRYTLRRLQRCPIGALLWRDLDQDHVVEHMQFRQKNGILPQTCNQDYTYLSGALKYGGSAWRDCKGMTDAALRAAKPFLTKHNLICKSEPRDRRPMPEEVAKLEVLAAEANLHPCNQIDMVRFARWQIASSRRLSESCRIEWHDWDYEAQTMLVHKMKDPRNRNKTKLVALTNEAQALLLEWAWEMNAKPETWTCTERRIHPYNAKSVGAKYTRLKHRAGIVGLRLHDSRAECYTRMKEKGIPASVCILVTGHESEALPERVYNRMKAGSFKQLQHIREQRAA